MRKSFFKRVGVGVLGALALFALAYAIWQPGATVTDGRHDFGRNALWLAHGWLGADEWFTQNGKTAQFQKYRATENVEALFTKLRAHHISDVFPHLCPATPTGLLPKIDVARTERFLDAAGEIRVMPWIGGPNGSNALIDSATWRAEFCTSIRALLERHPRLAGVHLNIEPLPSGDRDFLTLLDELRAALPPGKMLSVAAYPPPTRWHPFPEVHWEERYFREVARRSDQVAVMMYDAGQRLTKPYEKLMADWTHEVIEWSEGKPILLGVPAYDDAGVGYHDPSVENLEHAIAGIHRALSARPLPSHYQGIAIYSDWETSETEWAWLWNNFLRR